ncbi:hypothetical protein K2173_014143 [Erythroxylum novogranatense]|uniref:U6 snRNA-associated Sm-like protein LSm8 n=1 Tax=Erythroxylum novogranatense TaxID=1862640 RepID=A0AAV8SDW2_9ROSI|nr:hypothetical protein K2173_014143 [Erythroxylum novogranatense]
MHEYTLQKGIECFNSALNIWPLFYFKDELFEFLWTSNLCIFIYIISSVCAFDNIRLLTPSILPFLYTISVITNDGRNIVGVLKGFDQATNIILDESHERVYSTKEGVTQLVLGLYIIRGDNISVVGELDEELDSQLDLSNLRAHPLKPVIH